MTALDMATILILTTQKEPRNECKPEDFGDLSAIVSDLKANPKESMRKILKSEFGVDWDGGSQVVRSNPDWRQPQDGD